MKKTTTLAGLALAAVALGGCSGGDAGSGGTGGSAPASAAPAPASSAASGASSGAAGGGAEAATPTSAPEGPTPGAGAAAAVADPCDVIDAAAVENLSGVKVKKGTTQAVGGSNVCTWLPQDGTQSDSAVFSAQEGPLMGPLSQVGGQLKDEFDGKISKLEVAGADDARYVTGTKSGLNVIDVVAQRGQVFYQVLVASPRDTAQHKGAAVTIAETLLKA
jgi:hypothetical protein